jgi:probable DNA metabolism protein
MIVYRCEASLESVFTAVYLAYEQKRVHEDTVLCLSDEPLLFGEDVKVVPDISKTHKVIRTLIRRFGEDDYISLCMALASEDEESAQAVYRTIVRGLKSECPRGHLFDCLADANVHKAFALARGVSTEIGHQKQFLRFQELDNGVLYAKIGAKYDVMVFLMPHFADRLPIENFMIYDEKRNLFGIHPASHNWYLLRGEEAGMRLELSEEETYYQELFRHFCTTISIEGRRNQKLQKGMLPLRFREYMVEFASQQWKQ